MAILYVKSSSTGNGSAWNNAYGSLQSAITAAQAGDEIWVAAGTYKPTTGTDRTASFTLKNNVAIYGGFAGTETARNQRNIATNATILSGEIGVAGIADNSYHVVTATGSFTSPLKNGAILDGFTITKGNANGSNDDSIGGGIFLDNADPTLRNLTVTGNNASNGGGMYNEGSNPILTNVLFEFNTASNGAAIYNTLSSPTITNGTFRLNVATTDGGALYNINSSYPTFNEVTFSDNSANNSGGAVFNTGSSSIFNDVIFTSNSANSGGAIYSDDQLTINQGEFIGNTASYVGGGIYQNGGKFQLSEVTFAENKADLSGGAIYKYAASNSTITKGTFIQNRAGIYENGSGYGGAISNNYSDNLSLTNVSFIQNRADGSDGGAIYNSDSNGLSLTNATFSRNNAANAGGAIYQDWYGLSTSMTTITNSSFSGNAASNGSAIYSYGYYNPNVYPIPYISTTISNSIIWNHGGTALFSAGGSESYSAGNSNIIQNGQFGGLDQAPLFIDALNDDLRLENTSPAIDAGNPGYLPNDTNDLDGDGDITEAIPLDIARNPRINGTNVDMGAFEFTPPVNQPPVITNKTFTIAKSIAVGATVGTVPISDPENNLFTVTITNGNTDTDNDGTRPFAISNAGVITVTDLGDFGTNTSFNLTIAASDGSATGTGNAVINLNSPPTVNNATFSIVNNSAVGATVGTVTASDPENNPLTFSITNGNTDADNDGTRPFAINNSGVITVTDPGDFGTNNSFNLTVTANDGNATGNGAIVVNLTSPVNRPPVVNDAVFSISKTSPNGTVVGTINATDPDNNPLTYSITAGNPDTDGDTTSAFAISNTGVITVTDANDVSAQTNPFNLTIQANDGALTDTGIATINLNNVNPLSFQLKLYEDNNGTVGSEITSNNAILGNSFFAEILVGDIRTNAAGLIINSLDFGFAADVAQNINNFADIGNVNSPLITSAFPLFRGGTLDNTNGLIDNLSGGAVPEASQGTAIGINQLNRFSLLRFNVVGTRDNSNLNLTFDPTQIGFADGTLVDPNGTLSLTRNIIINDAPIVGSINNVNLAERSAVGTVVVAGNLVDATDDAYGQTPTFSLSTSPKDGSGNDLFAINSTTGEITLTQAGANAIDFESGVTSYQLGVKATDGYKLSTERTFNVNITNVNEGTIVVDKNAITFGTKLSQYRTSATDSLFVRPNFADRTQFIDITNTASGTNDVLAIAGITINAQNVTTDANFANGDILLNPGQTRRIALAYTPKAARENFNLANGLVINSNAQNNSALNIQLTGKSTFNSDISYDGRVNLTDLTTLQRPGLFGSSSGQTNYDPTADITGDGRINLAELVPFNSEFGLVI